MRDQARTAFGITATCLLLFLFGEALRDGLGMYFTGPGFLALAGTFAFFYILIFLWVLWFERKH